MQPIDPLDQIFKGQHWLLLPSLDCKARGHEALVCQASALTHHLVYRYRLECTEEHIQQDVWFEML